MIVGSMGSGLTMLLNGEMPQKVGRQYLTPRFPLIFSCSKPENVRSDPKGCLLKPTSHSNPHSKR